MTASQTLSKIRTLCREAPRSCRQLKNLVRDLDIDLCAGLALPSEWCALGPDTRPTVREGQLSAERDRLRGIVEDFIAVIDRSPDRECAAAVLQQARAALKGES